MKKKLIGGIAIGLILIVILAIGITAKKDEGKSNDILTEEKVKEILGDKGKVVSFKNNDKETVINMVAKGNEKAVMEDISKEQKADEKVIINFIEENIESSDDFYFEGLNKRGIVSKDEKTIESFEKKTAKKSINNAKVKEGKVLENKDGNIVIQVNVTEVEDQNAINEIKNYLQMFKNVNKEKNLKNVQVNFKGSEKGYKYNEKFEDILATVENIG